MSVATVEIDWTYTDESFFTHVPGVGDVIEWESDIFPECGKGRDYMCTAPLGHTGPHIAQDHGGEVVAVWA